MTTLSQLRAFEKHIKGMGLECKVHFFDNRQELAEAKSKGLIRGNDICFIDDVTDYELDEAITLLEDGKRIPKNTKKKIEHEMSIFNNPATKGQFSYLSDDELRRLVKESEERGIQ